MKKALYRIENGAVIQWQDWDKFSYAPPAEGLAAIALADEFEFPEGDWWIVNGTPSEVDPEVPATLPPLNESDARAVRDTFLRLAAVRIAPLQDAVDLDEATEEETAALTEWKRYRIDLNRIDQQPGFPAEVVWPTKPE